LKDSKVKVQRCYKKILMQTGLLNKNIKQLFNRCGFKITLILMKFPLLFRFGAIVSPALPFRFTYREMLQEAIFLLLLPRGYTKEKE